MLIDLSNINNTLLEKNKRSWKEERSRRHTIRREIKEKEVEKIINKSYSICFVFIFKIQK